MSQQSKIIAAIIYPGDSTHRHFIQTFDSNSAVSPVTYTYDPQSAQDIADLGDSLDSPEDTMFDIETLIVSELTLTDQVTGVVSIPILELIAVPSQQGIGIHG